MSEADYSVESESCHLGFLGSMEIVIRPAALMGFAQKTRFGMRASNCLSLVLLMSLPIVGCLSSAAASDHSNPADELASIINRNRTAAKLPELVDNPGLACIALQYIHDFQGDCDAVDKQKPANSLINSTFAPNCGVNLSTVTGISGILLGCQSDYVNPTDAFNNVLLSKNESFSIIDNKMHTEFGVAISGYAGGSPYYWCTMFSDGSPNSTFVFRTGNATANSEGCFSGTGEHCSGSSMIHVYVELELLVVTVISILLVNF